MLRAAVLLTAVAIGGCDGGDSDGSEDARLYDAQASLRCFKTLAPSEPPYFVGWRASPAPDTRRVAWGQVVYLTHHELVTFAKGESATPWMVGNVDVFFAESEDVAHAYFDRWFESAKITGHPRRFVQRRSNVLLRWMDPEGASRREIATVTRCLRRAAPLD